ILWRQGPAKADYSPARIVAEQQLLQKGPGRMGWLRQGEGDRHRSLAERRRQLVDALQGVLLAHCEDRVEWSRQPAEVLGLAALVQMLIGDAAASGMLGRLGAGAFLRVVQVKDLDAAKLVR